MLTTIDDNEHLQQRLQQQQQQQQQQQEDQPPQQQQQQQEQQPQQEDQQRATRRWANPTTLHADQAVAILSDQLAVGNAQQALESQQWEGEEGSTKPPRIHFDAGANDNDDADAAAPRFVIQAASPSHLDRAKEVVLESFENTLVQSLFEESFVASWLQFHILSSILPAAAHDTCLRYAGILSLETDRGIAFPAPNVVARFRHRREGSALVIELRRGLLDRDFDVQAIVNPTNPGLENEGGVSQSLAEACGEAFRTECNNLLVENGFMQPYQVHVSGSGNLADISGCSITHVLHVVPPTADNLEELGNAARGQSVSLRTTYSAVLGRAMENGFRRIAFPALGCGNHRVPAHISAQCLLDAIDDVDPTGEHFELIRVTIFPRDFGVMDNFNATFQEHFQQRHADRYQVDMAPRLVVADNQGALKLERTWFQGRHARTAQVSLRSASNQDDWRRLDMDANEAVDRAFGRFQRHIDEYGAQLALQGGRLPYADEASRTPDYDAMTRPKPFGNFTAAHLGRFQFATRREADEHIAMLRREHGLAEEDAVVLQRWFEFENRAVWNSARFVKIELVFKDAMASYLVIDFLHGWCYQTQQPHLFGLQLSDVREAQQVQSSFGNGDDAEFSVAAYTLHARPTGNIQQQGSEMLRPSDIVRRVRGMRTLPDYDSHTTTHDLTDQEVHVCRLVGLPGAVDTCCKQLYRLAWANIRTEIVAIPPELQGVVAEICAGKNLVSIFHAAHDGRIRLRLTGYTDDMDAGVQQINRLL